MKFSYGFNPNNEYGLEIAPSFVGIYVVSIFLIYFLLSIYPENEVLSRSLIEVNQLQVYCDTIFIQE